MLTVSLQDTWKGEMMQQIELSDNTDIEIITPMTKDEAEQWKAEVETTGRKLGELLYDGYKRDAWRSLGYRSWTQCVKSLAMANGTSKTYSFQLFEAERLKQDVLPIGSDNKAVAIATDVKESQLRPLSKIKDDNEKREAWQEAVETAPNGKITARHVETTVKTYQETKTAATEKAKDYITLLEWEALTQDEQNSLIVKDYQSNTTFNKTNDNIE
ncbi:MAG: hypothetical protein ACXAB7_25295, partial [Candidatus Kariarchaeaceae archaeon]